MRHWQPLLHHFPQIAIAIADRLGRVPANADEDDVKRKAHPFCSQHRVSSLCSQSAQHSLTVLLIVNATEPLNLCLN